MPRCLLLLLLVMGASGTEGYRLQPGDAHLYAYHMEAKQELTSAGETIAYTTQRSWLVLLRCEAVTDHQATVVAQIYRIRARHRGPGIDIAVDDEPNDDETRPHPLLAGLLAPSRIPLTLTVDLTTGRVLEVSGHRAIQEAAQALFADGFTSPALNPGIEESYGAEAWKRRWTEMLALPTNDDETIDLAPMAGGQVRRRWNGSDFTLDLPEKPPEVTIHAEPKPVVLRLSELDGSGSITMRDGVLQERHTTLRYSVEGQAMTQAHRQQHTITWSLRRLAADDADSAPPP